MHATIDTEPRGISAAGLTVTRKAPATGTIDRLRDLQATLGSEANKHDRALVLISACIAEGIDTSAGIIGTLVRLGFNNRHVAIMLKEGTGTSVELHRWRKGVDGRYTLLG